MKLTNSKIGGGLKTKGFTLIELLAVIIILAVVALIATPIVLNVIDDARTSAAESEANLVLKGINSYCEQIEMKKELGGLDEGDIDCKEVTTLTSDQLSKMISNLDSNTTIDKITLENGKVKELEITSNTKEVVYNNGKMEVQGDEKEETTYAAYSVGDEVTLTDGTTWVVVKDTTTSESEIKIMSTSNVHPNLTTETGTAMFLSESTGGYVLSYDRNESNVWANSTLKTYLDSTVKTKLEASLNTTISDITIWGAEELTALGCTVTGNDTDGYSKPTCDTTTTWYSKVFQNTYSWTKLPRAGKSIDAWDVHGDGYFSYSSVHYVNYYGARPVITISKSVISQ